MIGRTGELPLRTARFRDSGWMPQRWASSSVVRVRRPPPPRRRRVDARPSRELLSSFALASLLMRSPASVLRSVPVVEDRQNRTRASSQPRVQSDGVGGGRPHWRSRDATASTVAQAIAHEMAAVGRYGTSPTVSPDACRVRDAPSRMMGETGPGRSISPRDHCRLPELSGPGPRRGRFGSARRRDVPCDLVDGASNEARQARS